MLTLEPMIRPGIINLDISVIGDGLMVGSYTPTMTASPAASRDLAWEAVTLAVAPARP